MKIPDFAIAFHFFLSKPRGRVREGNRDQRGLYPYVVLVGI